MPSGATLITILPLWTVRLVHGAEVRSAVRLYHSELPICAHKGDRERCDSSRHYYGCDDDNTGPQNLLCARHWYGIQFHPAPVHHLLDMTGEEYARELGRLCRVHAESTGRVAERLNEFGHSLARVGFTDEAGKLYETAG